MPIYNVPKNILLFFLKKVNMYIVDYYKCKLSLSFFKYMKKIKELKYSDINFAICIIDASLLRSISY